MIIQFKGHSYYNDVIQVILRGYIITGHNFQFFIVFRNSYELTNFLFCTVIINSVNLFMNLTLQIY